jgi:hypothetical protein
MARRRWWKWLLVPAVLVLGSGLLDCNACARSIPPDARLAGHVSALCGIAEREVATPERGVHRLMRYLGDHGPDMLHDLGATVVLIERIDDDAAHDRRAREAHLRLRERVERCEEGWERFARAVENDPAARAAVDRNSERLVRTLQILLGAEAVPPLARWPRAWLETLGVRTR